MSAPPYGQPQQQQVIVQQQFVQPGMVIANAKTPWQKGLFSCFDDIYILFYSWCCGPCAVASARTEFDGSNWCFNCLCLSPAVLRSIVREGYNIEGGCCGDMFLSCVCQSCVICQAYNEVKTRGPNVTNRVAADNFRNGLFGCFKDCNTCVYGCCFPSCAIAQARSDFDGSDCCFNWCCVSPAVTLSIIREGYNINGNCCLDILTACACATCLACQLLNEVKERGSVNNAVAMVQTVTTTQQPYPQQAPGYPQQQQPAPGQKFA